MHHGPGGPDSLHPSCWERQAACCMGSLLLMPSAWMGSPLGVVLSPEPLDAVTGKVRECLLTASAAWARRVTGEGLQSGRGETRRAHLPVESGEQTRGKQQGSRVRGQGVCARPGERLPLVARGDWFLGSSGNSRRFSSDSPTTVRLWPLEIRLLCVGPRQESRGRGRSQSDPNTSQGVQAT